MNLEKIYNAKLMLAGEYGVIAGSEAITVPLKIYAARLAVRDENTDKETVNGSVAGLRKLLSYIASLPTNSFFAKPDEHRLNELLKQDYYIHSTIPHGYGIGSSGAVSALIYDQFFCGHDKLNMQQQRKDLATLESCFHGKSSGVDAMTCFTGKPLHFLPDGEIRTLETNPLRPTRGYQFFLLDSKEVFDTAPLVNLFLENMQDESFNQIITEDYALLIRKFIASVTGTPELDPALLFRAISDLQWNNFRQMIPEKMEDAWIEGQVSNNYYLKLNGSGGGFMLGIAAEESRETVESMLEGYELIWL